MTEQRLAFQYAILRYVHDVVTGEFINAGVVLYSKPGYFFEARLLTRYHRLTQMFPGADGEAFKNYMEHLQRVFDKISQSIASRQTGFLKEWPDNIEDILVNAIPPDDSSIQFSESRTGISADHESILEQLYQRYAEHYIGHPEKESRTDQEIWHVFKKQLSEANLVSHFDRHEVRTKYEVFEFDYAWKNGSWHVMQPLSFDLMHASYMRRKAKEWLGATNILSTAKEVSHIFMLLGHPRKGGHDLRKGYDDAKAILSRPVEGIQVELVEEANADKFAERIKPLVVDHSKQHK